MRRKMKNSKDTLCRTAYPAKPFPDLDESASGAENYIQGKCRFNRRQLLRAKQSVCQGPPPQGQNGF